MPGRRGERRHDRRRLEDKVDHVLPKPPPGVGERRSDREIIEKLFNQLDTLEQRYQDFVGSQREAFINFTHRVMAGGLLVLAMFGLTLYLIRHEANERADQNRNYITDTCQDFEDLKRSLRDTVKTLIPGDDGPGEAFALGQFAEAQCPPPDRLSDY